METRKQCWGALFLICLSTTTSFTHSEARSSRHLKKSSQSQASKHPRIQDIKSLRHWATYSPSDPFGNYYMGSPNSMPPYEDVMGPSSSPVTTSSPFCLNPPLTPLPPSTTIPTPILPNESPPPPPPSPPLYNSPPESSSSPSPPNNVPSPPTNVPTLPITVPSPPSYRPSPPINMPSPLPPPGYVPNPPGYVPSPPEFAPGPPIFLPPVVYPPPTVPPPPPYTATTPGLWCVAKPTVPDPIIQEAMNYACGSGADCDSIQPNGLCYQPDTLISHASFAFNSYWQRTKVAGGTCDFGGTAMLITKDPSYDGCHFIIS